MEQSLLWDRGGVRVPVSHGAKFAVSEGARYTVAGGHHWSPFFEKLI